MAAHCRALPALAKQLDDPLLNEVTFLNPDYPDPYPDPNPNLTRT